MNRALLVLVVLVSASAVACPVCGVAATEEGQEAYKFMSVIMSLLPLLAIGSVVSWVALRIRAAARIEAGEPERRTLTRFAPPESSQG
jgi:hypothetical protein